MSIKPITGALCLMRIFICTLAYEGRPDEFQQDESGKTQDARNLNAFEAKK